MKLRVLVVSRSSSVAARRSFGYWDIVADSLPSHVRDQLERLIAVALTSGTRQSCLPDGSGRVLLDVELRGVRCILVERDARPREEPIVALAPGLSPRELEIARMVAKGLTNKNIARVLDISLWTVSTHLRRIFAKLSVTTRAAMVAKIVETGTLPNAQELRTDLIELRTDSGGSDVARSPYSDVDDVG